MSEKQIDVHQLKKALSFPLPGEEAQYKMAPLARPRMAEMPTSFEGIRKAAVLVPLFKNGDHVQVLLTLRSTYEGVHSGQISFPGGKFEPHETDPIQVALRETEEEIGISSEHIEVLGLLTPLYIPVSKMYVQPVVAWLHSTDWFPEEKEVVEIVEVPISQLLDDQFRKTKTMDFPGRSSMMVPYFDLKNQVVWGATAMMLSELIAVLETTHDR